jgi:hypothetical protein
VAFEAALVAALIVAWPETTVRFWLLLALASHVLMRSWSAFDFIPKALAFERAEPSPAQQDDAQRWTRRSRLRLPLDVVSCGAMMMAFASVARLV